MAPIRVHFVVDVQTSDPADIVFVTGTVGYGNWKSTVNQDRRLCSAHGSLRLHLSSRETLKRRELVTVVLVRLEFFRNRWFGSIETDEEAVHFRYFIGYRLFGEV